MSGDQGNTPPAAAATPPTVQQALAAITSAHPNLGNILSPGLLAAANQALAPRDGAPGAAHPSPEQPFSARVKLYVKEGDMQPTNGSHEIITLDANASYGNLCQRIRTAFVEIQDGNSEVRRNIDRRCYWSDEHTISSIKAIWSPYAEAEYAGVEPNGDVTVLTEANISSVLAALKSANTGTLPTLSVVIRVPRGGD